MGGFYEGATGNIITLEMLMKNEDLRDEIAKTSEPIHDKSKADTFAKSVSILELSWFITQYIARANQHLTVTLLEVTALAFAVSSIIASLLWFYKPLNVRYHIRVGPESESVPPPPSATGNLSPVDNPTSPAPPPSGTAPLPPAEKAPSPAETASIPSMIECLLVNYSILLGAGRRGTQSDFRDGVPRFWGGGPSTDVSNIRAPTILAVGVLFGAIHCAAWSFSFPSYAEKMLWRFSSITVLIGLIGPSLIFIKALWVAVDRNTHCAWHYIQSALKQHLLLYVLISFVFLILFLPVVSLILILLVFFVTMLLCGLWVYTAGRIILIVLAFMQLRSLPPSSLNTVQWTTYIPHI